MALLAWKGKLAAVWQAATTQNKLKKSQCASIDVLSSLDLITSPSKPFALRQSAYLMLGVVRIHSKQVEYLLQDCKALERGLRKAISCTNVNVNLPEDATYAPYHSVTLPDTFELNAFNFNEDLDLDRFEDANLKSCEEITLEDQVLGHEDQYVAILIDEDIEKIPEIESMLDAVHGHHSDNVPLWEDQWNDVMQPDEILEELIMRDKETPSLVVEEMMESPSAISAGVQQFTNPQISFGHHSPDLVVQSTPGPSEEPKSRRRRRKLLIDADVVLTEDEINPLLVDTSAFKRWRKNAPLSSLDISKLNKRRRKDGMSFEPLLMGWCISERVFLKNLICMSQNGLHRKFNCYKFVGLCDDLRNIYEEDFVSAKIKMASSQEEDHTEPSDNQEFSCTDLLSEISPSPNEYISSPPISSPAMSTPSPSRRDDFTPSTCYRDVEDTVLSDIHEFDSSDEDLSFLDQDDRTPIGEQGGTIESDSLPARTRTVARFLLGKSSQTPISEDLSLNTILEGKNRKTCARMFYETLVLENCGLVNVNQNVPYGDITLKVTSRLNEQLSS